MYVYNSMHLFVTYVFFNVYMHCNVVPRLYAPFNFFKKTRFLRLFISNHISSVAN